MLAIVLFWCYKFLKQLQILKVVLICYYKCLYGICSKISNTFFFLFLNKFRIHKILVRIASREDPDETVSEEAV